MENNEVLTNVSQPEGIESADPAVEALISMEKTHVRKDLYDKLKRNYERVIEAHMNGEKIEVEQEKPVDINELRKELYNRDGDLKNLEYVDKTLKLREAIIKKGEPDPFLPIGSHVNLTADMQDKATAVANLLQECVDYADGDSGLFTARYQSLVKDTPGLRRR